MAKWTRFSSICLSAIQRAVKCLSLCTLARSYAYALPCRYPKGRQLTMAIGEVIHIQCIHRTKPEQEDLMEIFARHLLYVCDYTRYAMSSRRTRSRCVVLLIMSSKAKPSPPPTSSCKNGTWTQPSEISHPFKPQMIATPCRHQRSQKDLHTKSSAVRYCRQRLAACACPIHVRLHQRVRQQLRLRGGSIQDRRQTPFRAVQTLSNEVWLCPYS